MIRHGYGKLFYSATLIITLALLPACPAIIGAAEKSSSFYDIKIATAMNNGKSVATITITGKSSFKCNTMYPWKLTIKPGPGIKLEKTVLKKADAKKFAKEAVVFEVPYSHAAGQKVTADLKLSMCNDKICKMEKVSLTW